MKNAILTTILCINIIGLILLSLNMMFHTSTKPKPDQLPVSGQITIWTDSDTGCQYLITRAGYIERRMIDNGVMYLHLGCKPPGLLKK